MYLISVENKIIVKSFDLDYVAGCLAALQSLLDNSILPRDVEISSDNIDSLTLQDYQIKKVDNFSLDDLHRIALAETEKDKLSLWVKSYGDTYFLYKFSDQSFINGFANILKRYQEDYLAYIINACYVGGNKEIQIISQNPVFMNENEYLIDLTYRESPPNKAKEPEPQNKNDFGENVFLEENDRYI